MFKKTAKFAELLNHYAHMVEHGYERRVGSRVCATYSDQEAIKFRHELKPLFQQRNIRSVLDYGGGGGDWREKEVPEGGTLAEFLSIEEYLVFEPSRAVDDRKKTEAIVCFDVMEHIYLGDVGFVLSDIFDLAERLVVVNVATYAANALLPNGENAHITQRHSQWWRGVLELISAAHPKVEVVLYASESYGKATRIGPWRFADLNAAKGYKR
ncbi:MAG: hypothetical protein AAF557_21730 [Pseudomonadota bacterium]